MVETVWDMRRRQIRSEASQRTCELVMNRERRLADMDRDVWERRSKIAMKERRLRWKLENVEEVRRRLEGNSHRDRVVAAYVEAADEYGAEVERDRLVLRDVEQRREAYGRKVARWRRECDEMVERRQRELAREIEEINRTIARIPLLITSRTSSSSSTNPPPP